MRVRGCKAIASGSSARTEAGPLLHERTCVAVNRVVARWGAARGYGALLARPVALPVPLISIVYQHVAVIDDRD
jgi:hypothetical protein